MTFEETREDFVLDKVDLDIIEEIATLDPSNGNEFFKNQVVRFKEFAQEQLDEMKEGIDKKDRAMIEACAHSIGGAAANFGASELAAMLLHVEKNTQTLKFAELESTYEDVGSELKEFIEFLGNYLDKRSANH